MSRMKMELQKASYKDGTEALYKDTGCYRGVITDEETGKKYQVVGKDQLEGKPHAFGYGPKRDAVSIYEVEADGATKKADGLLIEGVHFHDFMYVRRDKFGDVADSEILTDMVMVYPDGEDNSHVSYELGGGWKKFGGSVKKISSVKNTGDTKRMELKKNDKYYGIYKALFNKNLKELVHGLLDASQTIRDQAKKKQVTKEQMNVGNTNLDESR